MLEPRGVYVGIAIAIGATTAVILVAALAGAVVRWRGGQVPRVYGRLLALLGGLTIGTLFLGRALRRRILPIFVGLGLAFGLIGLGLDTVGWLPFGL